MQKKNEQVPVRAKKNSRSARGGKEAQGSVGRRFEPGAP